MLTLSLEQLDSLSVLESRMKASQFSILLGEDDEYHRNYFLGISGSCAIGVCTQSHGLKPEIRVSEANEEAWVGYNNSIVNIDLNSYREIYHITLDCLFYTFLCQMEDGSIIVIYELGACRVGRAGELVWNRTTDVVTTFSDAEDSVHLQTEDEDIMIDKQSGKATIA